MSEEGGLGDILLGKTKPSDMSTDELLARMKANRATRVKKGGRTVKRTTAEKRYAKMRRDLKKSGMSDDRIDRVIEEARKIDGEIEQGRESISAGFGET